MTCVRSSVPRRFQPPRVVGARGFTLIEIIISIALIMLIMGMAVMSTGTLAEERRMREVTVELKDFAKKARAQALIEQRAFQIEFQPGFFRVQALQQVSEEQSAMQSLNLVEGDAMRAEELRRYNLPEDMTLEIRRWNRVEWEPAVARAWVFEHSGICEPLSVRLNGPKGYIEMMFNPLTANVEDEASEIN
ncbi:MAG: prepilin-type N-terminal cleavage/methylation domain-containing protein [Verrucomicrobiales bacterium]|nr:prepilin-type N-terminal cleavage/methylation domain-containing protein [Verrucomicrobiales bacterium]